MKHCYRAVIALALMCVLASGTSHAGLVGNLSLYADDGMSSCEIVDPGGGLISVYLVHRLYAGDEATGIRFRLDSPAGANWIYLTFLTPFTSSGAGNSEQSRHCTADHAFRAAIVSEGNGYTETFRRSARGSGRANDSFAVMIHNGTRTAMPFAHQTAVSLP
jgi:hypothetical protein